MGDDIKHFRTDSGARELVGLTSGAVAPVPNDEINEIEDAFSEWDESAPVPLLAEGSRRTRTNVRDELPARRSSGVTPESLEEAIRSVMDDEELYMPPVRYAAGTRR